MVKSRGGGGGGLAVICVSGVTGSSPQRDTRTSFLLNLRGKGPYCTSLTYNLKPNYFIFELTVWFNMIFFSSKQGCIKIIRFFWDPPTVYTVNYIPIIYLICCMLYYIYHTSTSTVYVSTMVSTMTSYIPCRVSIEYKCNLYIIWWTWICITFI